MTPGRLPKCFASAVTMPRFFSRMSGEVLQMWHREAIASRLPLLLTFMTSGYFSRNHLGGVAVGVHIIVFIPAS